MKFKSLACTGISFFSLLQPIVSLSATKQPNILFFMVDDMGWQDTSVPFADEKTLFNNLYETPNMERLARMGVKFTNAYAASVSSPSRCSLMTGANVLQHKHCIMILLPMEIMNILILSGIGMEYVRQTLSFKIIPTCFMLKCYLRF